MHIKTFIIVFIVFAFPLSVPANSATPEQAELAKWMTFYYQKPDPNIFPGKLKAFSAAGIFDEEKNQFAFFGFAGAIFKNNDDKVRIWLKEIDTLPRDHKKIILLALWLSDSQQAKEIFREDKYKEIISGENYYHFNTAASPPDVDKTMLQDKFYFLGGLLDFQWGKFFATGERKPIELIISALQFGSFWGSKDKYKGNKELTKTQKDEMVNEIIFGAALWSLQSNCRQHELVKKYCLDIYEDENANISNDTKPWLGVLITKVYPERYKLDYNKETKKMTIIPVATDRGTPISRWWKDREGNFIPDTSYRKSSNNFGAVLLFTDKDEDVFKRWEIPSPGFEIPSTDKIEKGKIITALILFGGCARDAKGNCNVIANYRIWRPDGKLDGDIPKVDICVDKPAPPEKSLGLAAANIRIIIEPHEPGGKYTVDAEVIDLNKKVTLQLRSEFVAVEGK